MEGDSRYDIDKTDVYDFATDIASAFEVVADTCGCEILQPLVLKVINVLEHLEASVLKQQSTQLDKIKLKIENDELRRKNTMAEELNMDFKEAEGVWQKKHDHFRETITRLQDDNKALERLLADYLNSQRSVDISAEELLIRNLKDKIELLTNELEEKDISLVDRASQVICMQANLEEQQKKGELLQRRLDGSETALMKLWKEKTDNQVKITQQSELLERTEEQLKEATEQRHYFKEVFHSAKSHAEVCARVHCDDVNYLHKDNQLYVDLLLEQINDLQGKLVRYRNEIIRLKGKYREYITASQHGSHGIRQLFRFFLQFVSLDSTTFRAQ